jgi:parallel beta helix pectate lyase-like protein
MHPARRLLFHATTLLIIALEIGVPITSSMARAGTACSGVVLASGSNIQQAVNAAPAGATFCLSGNYTTTTAIAPKEGDAFVATGPTNISSSGSSGVFTGGRNVTYAGLGIGPSRGDGLRPGDGSIIVNSIIHDNTNCGISTVGNNLTITGNEITRNGSTSTTPISQACGLKIRGMDGRDSGAYSTISNNLVHDNVHTALWVDCNGHDNVFANNEVYGNTGIAFSEETGYRNQWIGNDVHDNGFGFKMQAVSILDSIGGVVSANTFTNNYRGIRIWSDRRATQSSPLVGTGCAGDTSTGYIPSGISITGNRFTTDQRTGFAPNGVALSAATFDQNCYTVANMSNASWQLPGDSTATWSQWRSAGKDPTGTAQTVAC